MWRLKVAEGCGPWLRSTNNHVGREVWEFDPTGGTPEEIAEYEKENPVEMKYPVIRIQEAENISKEAVETCLRKVLTRMSVLQAHDGHWPGDTGAGPMFLLPGLVISLHITGALNTILTPEHQKEMRRYLRNHQCHYSYSDCGLGSDGTDRLVKLVQEMQHCKASHDGTTNLFGAKITGGGAGGSVCIIGRNCMRSYEEILKIQQRYKAATGYLPIVFTGSSPGAGKFGYLKIRRRISSHSN